jgi:hypothetical protein
MREVKNQHILIKTPQYEIEFSDLCNKQYKKTLQLLNLIEGEFDVSMDDYQKLRKYILDLSNFTKRIPNMITEIVDCKGVDKHDY